MEIGQDENRFWSFTLREISVILDGAIARQRREHNNNAWMAWHIAALQRIKKMPKLDSMLQKEQKLASVQRRPVTMEEVKGWLSKAPKRKR